MATEASRRSSSFGRRLRLGLWAAVAAGSVALVVILVVSFLPQDETRREVVARYITEVNRVEVGLAQELTAISDTYREFGGTPAQLAAQVPELERGEETVRRLRVRLAAVEPPPEAERLHALLLELVDLDAAFAGEVAEFARYLPELSEAQQPLAQAGARLREEVGRAETAVEQGRAFAAYAAATRAVAERIEELDVPRAFVAAQEAEVGQLGRIAALSERIARALDDERPDDAVTQFEGLAREAAATAVVRAEREAALAYNRRLREIERVAKAIDVERTRLERVLD